MQEKRRTNCHYCGYLCAFEATVEDDRLVDLQPDPTRYPYNSNTLAACRRWRMNVSAIDGPDRVNYPLKRVGERGSGKFERVSWDDALDDIAQRLRALADTYGSETLASMIGGPHTSFWPLHRFMNLFGSPNNVGIGQICWNPRIWMDVVTFGWTVEADIQVGLTECVIIWGTNPAQSDNSAFWQALISVHKQGVPLICIDPRRCQMATLADVWLPIAPGTDCVLALGLLHILIENDWYNKEFVDAWCYGFDELKAHVEPYTAAYTARVCGLPEEDIVEVARMFGTARAAALVSGRGIDQAGRNVAPTHRAICCLRAITGNVDKPGACIMAETSDFVPEVDLEMTSRLGEEHKARCLNTPYTPLQCYDGYAYMDALTARLGNHLPARYLTSAHPDLVLRAMEEGEPYPIRALVVQATNPLLTYADTHRVFRAFQKLELLVVLEYYLTPTAQIADYVLPSAGAIERPLFQAHGGVANIGYGGPAAVEPYYERKCDYEIFRELGLRLGQSATDDWPEETFVEALRATLEPCGMTWEEFCKTGIYAGKSVYKKYAKKDDTGNVRGFATNTGKIELSSVALKDLGGDALPKPFGPFSLCSEELRSKGVHIPMITGARKQPFNASMYFNNEKFRKQTPYAVAEVSAATAENYHLPVGEPVILATDYGQASFILKTTRMRDNLISVDYGWWKPEAPIGAPDFGGIWSHNVNCLTQCSVASGEDMIGTWWYNAIDCVILTDTAR